MRISRRDVIASAASLGIAATARPALAQQPAKGKDRVFICNEDSNTLSVIDPERDQITATVNLTSFDEDPRPPFRYITGGVIPTHVAMVRKPLYHGAIDIHGAAPSPDDTLIATTGRGTSNVYLIETATLKVIGNTPNPQAGPTTNSERLSSGIIIGREPHEPTFSRNGRELWVTVRGENRIAIIDVEQARQAETAESGSRVRRYLGTINGPAQVWFSKDGQLAFVVSQKSSQMDVLETNFAGGQSNPKRLRTIDLKAQDPRAFTPFLKTSPEGTGFPLLRSPITYPHVVHFRPHAPFRLKYESALGSGAHNKAGSPIPEDLTRLRSKLAPTQLRGISSAWRSFRRWRRLDFLLSLPPTRLAVRRHEDGQVYRRVQVSCLSSNALRFSSDRWTKGSRVGLLCTRMPSSDTIGRMVDDLFLETGIRELRRLKLKRKRRSSLTP
jgi:YVTN family beta-propeller protein